MKQNNCRYGKARLGFLLLLLPLTVWFCGWRKTVVLWQWYQQNEKKLQEIQLFPDTLKTPAYEQLSHRPLLRDGQLLERIRQIEESRTVTILNYVPWLTLEENGVQLYSAELTLAGGYIPMLKILAALEQEGKYVNVAAACFSTHTIPKNREKQLQLTLWIQQIIEK